MKILIVEDENPELFAEAIRAFGKKEHEIIIALDGLVGVKSAEERKPDAIIMDWRLPGCDGLEAIQRIRRFDAQVPIFFVTAYGNEYIRKAVMDAGANLCLPKPTDFKILVAQIEALDD